MGANRADRCLLPTRALPCLIRITGQNAHQVALNGHLLAKTWTESAYCLRIRNLWDNTTAPLPAAKVFSIAEIHPRFTGPLPSIEAQYRPERSLCSLDCCRADSCPSVSCWTEVLRHLASQTLLASTNLSLCAHLNDAFSTQCGFLHTDSWDCGRGSDGLMAPPRQSLKHRSLLCLRLPQA